MANGDSDTIEKDTIVRDSAQKTGAKKQYHSKKDTADVHIALTPTLECLPFYYAGRHGLFSRQGISVSVLSYTSQMDADTALLGQTAEVGATDLVRVRYYLQRKQHRLRPVIQTQGIWMLIAHSNARIHNVDGLERKMLAVARFSASDFYSTEALQKTKLHYNDLFRPQVNDYYIRLNMLLQHQVDAAILPEPFATYAIRKGHSLLFTTSELRKKQTPLVGCFAAREDWSDSDKGKRVLKALTRAYNDAVREINAKGNKACSDILVSQYHIDEATAQQVRLPKYQQAEEVKTAVMETADSYLEARGIRVR